MMLTISHFARKAAALLAQERFALLLAATATLMLVACGEQAPSESAGAAAIRQFQTPQGRILTANQGANSVSLIDVATDVAYGTVPTGQQPHHVVATPDGKEFWVSLYKENRVQVFDAATLAELASVDVGASNDDLTFDPAGKRLYVSLGASNAIAVVDVAARKLLKTVKVGATPHGVKVSPDGKWLLVTNTADNTVSILTLDGEAAVAATVKTGANPFEVAISADSATAYVSNFLGDSITVLDIKSAKAVGAIRTGKQPAMVAVGEMGSKNLLAVANTGSADLWLIDPATRKLVTRIPAGTGAHGVVTTPSGKLYVTNSKDNTVTVIDEQQNKALKAIAVANNPNGLTFLPNPR
jgi:YVTN family beta-propeller protein